MVEIILPAYLLLIESIADGGRRRLVSLGLLSLSEGMRLGSVLLRKVGISFFEKAVLTT
jgi:hypothetical protein